MSAAQAMLNEGQVVGYLLRQGLITARSIVDGDLTVLSTARRNAGFSVTCADGAYMIKQAGGPDRAAGIANEAAIYQLLAAQGALAGYLPRLYGYSAAAQLLTLELLPLARTFNEYHAQGRFSTRLAAQLGRALAALHTLPVATTSNVHRTEPPWVLSLHQPTLNLYRQSSAASVSLLRLVQQFPAFGALLGDWRAAWRSVALVHYDVKWDNLLVVRGPRLKIIDWEMAGLGDPAWDAGAALGEYLHYWVQSIPVLGAQAPDQMLEFARFPLARSQPAMRSFWRSYAAGRGLTGAAALSELRRVVGFAGARLAQTALERSQDDLWLTSNAVLLLQLAFNIMQRPEEAAEHLLGIAWAGATP